MTDGDDGTRRAAETVVLQQGLIVCVCVCTVDILGAIILMGLNSDLKFFKHSIIMLNE